MNETRKLFWGHKDVVRPDWIDYNGHFNAGYYAVCFDDAIETWMDHIGLGPTHREEFSVTTFSAENHITYLQEVAEGSNLSISTQLLGFDRKRIHALQTMWNSDEEFLAATCEVMSLHVSEETRRVSEMSEAVYKRLAEIWLVHRDLAVPPQVGHQMGVPSK